MMLTDSESLHGGAARNNGRDPTPSPGSRSRATTPSLVWPARTSSGENSRTKLQNVVADSTAGRGGKPDNALTKLVSLKMVKQQKIKGGRGSDYSLA